jgi:hypothetical protein
MSVDDAKASPEIKRLIETVNTDKSATTAQQKFDAILQRKRYDLDSFLNCILLRLESSRGQIVECDVQKEADATFQSMLQHSGM